MNKVIRDGKVAVLYAPGYGAGWYSWHNKEDLLFDPVVVLMVEEDRRQDIPEYVKDKYKDEYICVLGAEDLKIEWMDEGTAFEIHEYDGFESIRYLGDSSFIVA